MMFIFTNSIPWWLCICALSAYATLILLRSAYLEKAMPEMFKVKVRKSRTLYDVITSICLLIAFFTPTLVRSTFGYVNVTACKLIFLALTAIHAVFTYKNEKWMEADVSELKPWSTFKKRGV